jgi:hypothetical protein
VIGWTTQTQDADMREGNQNWRRKKYKSQLAARNMILVGRKYESELLRKIQIRAWKKYE